MGLILAVLGGMWAIRGTTVDAIPDLSDVQVIIFTEYAGQAPQVVEDQVTYPITSTMLAVPYAKVVRGYSFFGFSFVYVIFEDGTDLYWARSRVLEYLSGLSKQLPPGVAPQLGPDATGVGWAFMYVLNSENHSLADLRSYQDWYLRYGLTSVEGVAEVASIGGFVRQYQVEVDPVRLRAYGIPINEGEAGDSAIQHRCRWSGCRDGRKGIHGPGFGLCEECSRPRDHRAVGGPGRGTPCCSEMSLGSPSAPRSVAVWPSGTARGRLWAASLSFAREPIRER